MKKNLVGFLFSILCLNALALDNLIHENTTVVTSSIIKSVPSANGCREGSLIKLSKNILRDNTYIINFNIVVEQEVDNYSTYKLNSRYWTEKDPMVKTKLLNKRVSKKNVAYKYEEDSLDAAISRCESIISELNSLK